MTNPLQGYSLPNFNYPAEVIVWAAAECERQRTKPAKILGLLDAWHYATIFMAPLKITVDNVIVLATKIEHSNGGRFRTTPATFANGRHAVNHRMVRALLERLIDHQFDVTADEFAKEFLDIHPFADGNGRTASVLWNLLSEELESPLMLPYFYGEE